MTTSLALAGAQNQLVSLAIALKNKGWDIGIISMIPPQAYLAELKEQNIFVYSLDMQRGKIDWRALFRLVKILKKVHPDILHCHMVHANLLGRIARIFVSIPVVVSSAHNVYEGGRERNWWYRLTDFLCDMTTQVSKDGVRRYVACKMVNPKKIAFLPNGIDIQKFNENLKIRQQKREELKIGQYFVWLAVGRFDEAKDYGNMISAFSVLHRDSPNNILLIAGDGDLRFSIGELVSKKNLTGAVKFLGVQQDISGLMNTADAYVMSSAWEGMPMVLLEAAASCLPVVATDVGGNKEIVQEGRTGFLVPSKQPGKLAEAMLKISQLPDRARREMGQAGRKYVEENYSLEEITTKWEELYSKLSNIK
ncbi:MAG: glycosyltransferase [Candidatus Omnitrophica bacterium]|nr:glycosyltransferase [Candidatus Omnitrophota bacterium]